MSSTLLGSSHPSKTAAVSASSPFMLSQHKRSLSFNHHLSYNQYTGSGGSNSQPKSLGYINNSGSMDSHTGVGGSSSSSSKATATAAAKGAARNVKGECASRGLQFSPYMGTVYWA